MHSSVIIKGYREAMTKCIERIRLVSIKIADEDPAGRREILKKCGQTSLNSKIISKYKEFFADMVVKAVEHLEDDLDKSFIGIKKVTGGSVTDSFLVEGVAFKKTFSYAGFEQQPKKFTDPKIALLNIELELKSERENAEIRLDNPEDYQKIVDAEWKLIYDKL
jgi:T-complex protein 1 subunit eta